MTREILLAIASSDSTAELLREVRKARKITILEIAKKTGINRNTISGILNGNLINNARLSTISKISHALNCDLRIELKPFESITYKPPNVTFCPNCECDRDTILYSEVRECTVCHETFEVVCGIKPSNSDVSMAENVLTSVKTGQSIENTNPDYYKQEIDRLTAENERLSQLLHDEMSQLQIATDLGNKRWLALNDIYENGEKHNSNWCKRKAQEGLSSK